MKFKMFYFIFKLPDFKGMLTALEFTFAVGAANRADRKTG